MRIIGHGCDGDLNLTSVIVEEDGREYWLEIVRHGRWICDGSKHGSLGGMCSQCYWFCKIAKYYEYCPHCGAKMDGKEG